MNKIKFIKIFLITIFLIFLCFVFYGLKNQGPLKFIYQPSYDLYEKYQNFKAEKELQRKTQECEKNGGKMNQNFIGGWVCSNSSNIGNKNFIY